MERREFISGSLASASLLAGEKAKESQRPRTTGLDVTTPGEVIIERAQTGQPHRGKVLASIAPHSDDHSILSGGTIAKLVAEGYTAYLIRTSNDEMDSYDLSSGKTIAANEADNEAMRRHFSHRRLSQPAPVFAPWPREKLRAPRGFLHPPSCRPPSRVGDCGSGR